MIQIKLLKDWQSKKAGDIINISKKGAEQFIEVGAGEYVNTPKKEIKKEKEIPKNKVKKEPYVSKEDFERLMAQGNRKDMERLFDYEVIKFKESKKNKGEIKVLEEYATAYSGDYKKEDEKVKEEVEREDILLDGNGRSVSDLCEDVSNILKDKKILFYRPDSRQIVEVGKVKTKENDKNIFDGFLEIKDKRFVTLIEMYARIGQIYKGKFGDFFGVRSLSPQKASIILASHIIEDLLPQIKRIFSIPLPIIYKDKLTFPKRGYDERFCSWLPYDSPEIIDKRMDVKKAKEIINNIFSEFCFKSEQDKTNAIASLLTPYLKGLLQSFNERTPVFFYLGNRERVGKDYCAGINSIVYDGKILEDNPINTGERGGNNNEELRKKITSALISGRKRMHFSNNKGHINNSVFESAITSKFWSDRMLGRNEMVNIPNEIDFSLSGNIGVTYTPDLANRCRFINLFLEIEDANSRKFGNPKLHETILKDRENILSALYSLVRNWYDNGKPEGSIPFTSFSDWAEVCGGIMECAGYNSPCITDKNNLEVAGDSETSDMKQLFEICYFAHPNTPIKRNEIIRLINGEEELFSYLDFGERKGQINFGLKLRKFIGRIFSDIKLEILDRNVRTSRQEYIFKKGGNDGNDGYVTPTLKSLEDINIYRGQTTTNYTTITKLTEKEQEILNLNKEKSKEFTDEELKEAGYSREEFEVLIK